MVPIVRRVLLLVCGAGLVLLPGCSWVRQLTSQRDRTSERLADRARDALDRGDLNEARSLLDDAVRTNPESAALHRELARVYRRQENWSLTSEHLQQAVRLEPDDADTRVRYAEALFEQGQPGRSAEEVEAALAADPSHAGALLLKGRLAESRGAEREALEVYHQLLEVQPDHVEGRMELARLQIEAGRPELAAPLLRSVCECPEAEAAEKGAAWRALGIAYGRDGRWSEAAEALRTAVSSRTETTADDWYRIAYAEHRAGERGAAERALEAALGLDASHGDALLLRRVLRESPGGVVRTGHSRNLVPVPAGW